MSIPHPRPGRRAERQELRRGSGVPGSKNPPGIAATADCPGAWARPNTDRRFAANCRSVLGRARSEEYTSELQSRQYLVCRLLLEKKKKTKILESTASKDSQRLRVRYRRARHFGMTIMTKYPDMTLNGHL